AAALPLLAGNDATFSAVAEARRGAAVGAVSSVHIYMDSGVGGAIIDAGRVVLGANGRAGDVTRCVDAARGDAGTRSSTGRRGPARSVARPRWTRSASVATC